MRPVSLSCEIEDLRQVLIIFNFETEVSAFRTGNGDWESGKQHIW